MRMAVWHARREERGELSSTEPLRVNVVIPRVGALEPNHPLEAHMATIEVAMEIVGWFHGHRFDGALAGCVTEV